VGALADGRAHLVAEKGVRRGPQVWPLLLLCTCFLTSRLRGQMEAHETADPTPPEGGSMRCRMSRAGAYVDRRLPERARRNSREGWV
jgi:hypothetical protein